MKERGKMTVKDVVGVCGDMVGSYSQRFPRNREMFKENPQGYSQVCNSTDFH
jgi:hypothetical protein